MDVSENIRRFEREVENHLSGVPGVDDLMEWLRGTDFYHAPASGRYHGAFDGGLLAHSLSVLDHLRTMNEAFSLELSERAMTMCALFHDLCKVNFYKASTRNVKNEATGQWEKVPFYTVEDQFPYGHGEKSVFLIERFMRLKTEEAVAIRWHMGGFDDAARGGSFAISAAFEKHPLALLLHLADMQATYLDEVERA